MNSYEVFDKGGMHVLFLIIQCLRRPSLFTVGFPVHGLVTHFITDFLFSPSSILYLINYYDKWCMRVFPNGYRHEDSPSPFRNLCSESLGCHVRFSRMQYLLPLLAFL